MIASEYGITLNQFGDMTSREVFMCIKRINVRRRNDAIFDAGIHGAELKPNDTQTTSIVKEDKHADKASSDAYFNLLQRREALKNVK